MLPEVFTPLKMSDSSYIWENKYIGVFAFPHDMLGNSKFIRHSPNALSWSSLRTTAGDYAKFLIAISNDNYIKNTMLKKVINVNNDLSWGLGFGIEQINNNTVLCIVSY